MGFPTTVPVNPAVAVEGMLADNGPADKLSKLAGVTIPFGKFVVFHASDTPDQKVKLPASSAEVTAQGAGFSVYDPQQGYLAAGQYVAGDMMPVLARGRIWVKVEQSVTPSDPVFIRYADGTVTSNNGGVRKDADSSTAAAMTNMRFLTSASANALVEIQINNP